MREKRVLCKIYMQFVVSVNLLVSGICCAKSENVSRKPANFIPDDDLIVVPLVIEKSVIEEFHNKHENKFKAAKQRMQFWQSQEQYAQDYGLEDSGIISLPTPEEKQRFLNRNYLRFISKDVERSTNKTLQNSIERWTTDDEIDSIKAIEEHEKVIIKARSSKGRKNLSKSKTVKVGKSDFKFGFQARPEIGMARFTIRSSYLNARAWVGVNGNQEIKLERRFKSTGTMSFVNYYIDESRVLAVIDQKVIKSLTFRYSHAKDVDGFSNLSSAGINEDNVFQLRYNVQF